MRVGSMVYPGLCGSGDGVFSYLGKWPPGEYCLFIFHMFVQLPVHQIRIGSCTSPDGTQGSEDAWTMCFVVASSGWANE